MVRKKEKKRRKRPLWFRLLVLVFFVAAFAALGAYILTLPVWEIKEVIVNGAGMLSDGEIRTLAAIPLSENLFFTSFSRTKANLGKITPIKSFRIYRIPPATVLINIREREPLAALVFPRKSMIIDKEGYILNRNPNLTLNIPNMAELPVVTGMERLESEDGERIDRKSAKLIADIVIKLSQYLESSRLQLELGGLREINFRLDDLLRVRVGDDQNIKRKMEVFGALLPVISGRWDQVEYVDVRYPENPVIKYK